MEVSSISDAFDSIEKYKPSMIEKIWWKIKNSWDEFTYFFRKIVQTYKHGFPDEQAWEFASWHSSLVVPRLKRLKEISHGFPCGLSLEEWNSILDKMIWSFEHNDDHIDPIYSDDYKHGFSVEECDEFVTYKSLNTTGTIDWSPIENHRDRVQEGLELFAKYYTALWD